MAKPPPNIPTAVGERVTLRANSARHGVIREMSPRLWCRCDWDDGNSAPKIVHQYELKTQTVDGSQKTCV
jgi:hypothetical protein